MRLIIRSSTARTWPIALATGVVAGCLAFAAYGYSRGSSTVAIAASTGPVRGNHSPPPGPDPVRYKALRECLRKNGLTPLRPPVLPPPGVAVPPGAPMPPGASMPPGAPMPPGPAPRPGGAPPKAMSHAKRAHIRAALRKCGAPAPPPGCNEVHPRGYPRHGRHRS